VDKGLIPDDIINRIRERADIKEVVEAHLSLTKAGQHFKGLCPFHSEKTPSFTVSPSRQMFHCFGCGTGGNVFTFMMKMDGLTFPAAVRALGEKVGILVEEKTASPAARQRTEQRERLLGLHQAVADLFHRTLLSDPAAEPARVYLDDRGISSATIERFGIGFAPPAWEWLGKAMSKTGWKAEDLAVSGLIVARDSAGRGVGEVAGYYDRFRGRVLFPIRDLQKRVIGFGGRVLDNSEPKYLNSPETPLFSKGRTLYALEAAREGMARLDHVVVVEGYFDAVSLHQAGLTNVVATLGTALTEEHVELIRRFTRRVVLLFDPDAAGVRAALRTMDLFLGSGLSVKVGSLPQGDDPDTFIRTRGVEAFVELVGRAPSLLEFAVQGSLKSGLQGGVDDRVRCVEEVLALLQKLSNPVEKSAALRHVADQLGMDEKVLLERFRMLPRRGGAMPAAATPASAGAKDLLLPKDEQVLVHLLVHNALSAEMLAQLFADDFTDLRARHLVALVLQAVAQEEGQAMDGLTRTLEAAADDPFCGGIARALSLNELPYDDAGAAFRESLKALKLRRIGSEIQDIKVAQASANREGQAETFRTLLMRMNALQQERQRLLASAPSPRTDSGRVNA
jgi:DNA primase